jgi:hypothetical protein
LRFEILFFYFIFQPNEGRPVYPNNLAAAAITQSRPASGIFAIVAWAAATVASALAPYIVRAT